MKTKSLILVLTLLASIFLVTSPKPATTKPDNHFYLNPACGPIGANVNIAVMLDSVNDLYAYEFWLRWDKTVLQFKNVTGGWLGEPGYSVTLGYELHVYAGLYANSTSTPVALVNITWTVLKGGFTWINFTEHHLWRPGPLEIPSTHDNGYFYTEEPYADFFWTPPNPRAGETVTFNASASYSPEGLPLTYQWYIDNVPSGTAVTTTAIFPSYSTTPHNITLTVTDSESDSSTVQKDLLINRDLAIDFIWPSIEDYQGSIPTGIPAGKTVVILVEIANNGTRTEYTDNSTGDFPQNTKLSLYLIYPDGSEELLGSTAGKRLRRYRWSDDGTSIYYKYDWAPTVGVSKWFYWYTFGLAPGEYYLKATLDGLPGETNLTNNELTFGPIKMVHGYEHDVAIDGIMDDAYPFVGYFTPYAPYGTNMYYFYGGKFDFTFTLDPNAPYPPGSIRTIDFFLMNIGKYKADVDADGSVGPMDLGMLGAAWGSFGDPWTWVGDPNYDTRCDLDLDGSVGPIDLGMMGAAWGFFGPDETGVAYNVTASGTLIYSGTIDMPFGDYEDIFFNWDTTGWAEGTYTLQAHVTPVPGETGKWATWDNNLPEQTIPFFNAYDDWGIYSAFP